MPSRIMHVCIGEMVCTKLKLDRNRFLIGTVSPDAYYNRDFKKLSHFFLSTPSKTAYIDCDAFLEKYRDSLQDDFFLGYYCHLLSDNLFHELIASKYLHPYEIEDRKRRLSMCYHDFGVLNGKLIQYYNLNNDFVYFDDFSLEEIDAKSYRNVVDSLMNDFEVLNTDQLQIYEFAEIIDYLNGATDISRNRIEEILITRDKLLNSHANQDCMQSSARELEMDICSAPVVR